MGWVLEAAPANGNVVAASAWQTLAQQDYAAAASHALVDLATLDPALGNNTTA